MEEKNKMKAKERDICPDSRKCFARGESGRCRILSAVYEEDGACPFRKAEEGKGGISENKKMQRRFSAKDWE